MNIIASSTEMPLLPPIKRPSFSHVPKSWRYGAFSSPGYAGGHHTSSVRALRDRELTAPTMRAPAFPHKQFLSRTASRMPALLREHELELSDMDKIFSGVWLSDHEVVLGSKCNTLLHYDINSGRRVQIPTIGEITGTATRELPAPLDFGIRSLAINPSGTRLLIAGGKPFRLTVYELPSFKPVAIFDGHADMIFTAAWLSDESFATGSRDGSLRFWSLSQLSQHTLQLPILDAEVDTYTSILTRHETNGKVRSVLYSGAADQVAALSTRGLLKFWDARRGDLASFVALSDARELVATAADPSQRLFAVGSQAQVAFVDSRMRSEVHTAPSLDEEWGVRSLAFSEHVVAVAGGLGRISFYDLRARAYVDLAGSSIRGDCPQQTKEWFETGHGWLCWNDNQLQHHLANYACNVVHSMTYDESGMRLLTTGGPLYQGVCGSYAAIWS
ncbi:uncharacterized protein VTP21DRAFT_3638 [Calcarisporiella thermophila]|uniref:uncharacterized protein n=1 Tax=Calcarisporiella thermophila TaxID=911321 RepID=UPI003743B9B4